MRSPPSPELGVVDLVAELRAGALPGAVARRALQRFRAHISALPSRARSTRRWVVGSAAAGIALLGFAGAPVAAWCVFVPWFTLVAWAVWLLQGYVRRLDGQPYQSFLLPNGLTFLRLSLAPLTAWPVLTSPSLPSWASLSFLVGMALLDLLDGQIARRAGSESRLGRMLDPTADIALTAFLAAGLHASGQLGTLAYAVILLRYPGTVLSGLAVILFVGPYDVESTKFGKVAGFTTSVLLSLFAAEAVLGMQLLPRGAREPVECALALLLTVNLGYLARRALALRQPV